MVKGVLDSTSTSSDFYTVFDNMVATNPHLNETITKVKNENNLFLVKVLRFYTRSDIAYVEELDSGSKYYCHITHEMLSYEVSLNCMCEGSVESGGRYGTYVKPSSNIYGIVANVRFKDNTDEKCLLACLNYGNDDKLKSDVMNGEIRLVSGGSTLSLTNERISLTTPRLFVNGLPYEEPKLNNYYDKTEINTIKSDTDAQIDELVEDVNTQIEEIDNKVSKLTNMIYPLGSIYMSVNSTNPSVLFGGTWEQIQDRFLLASGQTYQNGATGGSSTVALTKAQMPRHNHTQAQHRHKQTNKYSDGNTGSEGGYTYTSNRSVTDHYTDYQTPVINHTGGTGTTNVDANGSPHENMPPYLAVYVWKRIA